MKVYPNFKDIIILGGDDQEAYDFYMWALLVMEVLNFISYFASLIYVKKTFNIFSAAEYDMIRNNFTTNFYNLQRDSEAE
jgi:hypothetical protein